MNNLINVEVLKEYTINDVCTDDEEMKSFLFTLGCYSGEPITVVAKKKNNLVVALKDARYNFDCDLASVVYVK